jgi:uncharacterized protein YkwD
VNHLKRAPGRVFLVAFLATAGLLASAAPGLATEQPDPVTPLAATAPAAPAQPAAGPAAPIDDTPDGESSGSADSDDASTGGGWSDRTRKADNAPGDSTGTDPGDNGSGSPDTGTGKPPSDGGNGSDFSDQGDPDDSSAYYGDAKQTKAERAAAERSGQKAKALQQKAQKKAKAGKKSSSAKQRKARAAAAKKMKQQAVRAAKRAAAERAAEKRSAQQRSAVADDDAGERPRSGGSIDSLRDAILDLTNKARKSAGCGSLRYSTQLEKSAQWMANDMSEHHYMSHNDRQGRNSDKRIRTTGFNGDKTGENLGEGFDSPSAVFQAWMNSPSHRRNILDCGFRILGVGFASSGGYWVQHFGG